MELTSGYLKGADYLPDANRFECWLANARGMKNVLGRPKPTDPRGLIAMAGR
jgi:transposase